MNRFADPPSRGRGKPGAHRGRGLSAARPSLPEGPARRRGGA